jgi:hypothetical protein
MVPLDVGSMLGGSGDKEFKGVTNITCDPRMLERIPEGIDKIHCDIALEKALKEAQKAIWPDMFPPIEDFVELCKDFSFQGIQKFVPKFVKQIITGGAGAAADAVSGLLGGKKYDKIEPICIESLLDRGNDCLCNRHPGTEVNADESKEEFVMELFREYPPMLLMPVIDAGLLRLILKMVTLFQEESESEDDEIKLQIIWLYMKFKEYKGYMDDSGVPVPNFFSGAEKLDREANLNHYHWYNMEVLNAYLVKEGVSVEEFNFIDTFFEFTEIKERITGFINNIYDKPLYDRELFDQLLGQVDSVVDVIKEEIPVDIEIDLGLDRIIDNFFPAPTCGEFLEKFGIKPDTMPSGGSEHWGDVGWGGKIGIAVEVFLLEMIKMVIHEAVVRPLVSEDKTDPIEVGATTLAAFIGVIPIVFSDAKVDINGKKIEIVRVIMHFLNIGLVLIMAVVKIAAFIAECTTLGGDKKKITNQVFKGFVLFFGLIDRLGSVIASCYQLSFLLKGESAPGKEIDKVPESTRDHSLQLSEKQKENLKGVAGYIFFDVLGLERTALLARLLFLPASGAIKKWTKSQVDKELKDILRDFNTPAPSGFRRPWDQGTKQSDEGFYGLLFLRNFLDWVVYEIIVELFIAGLIPALIGSGISGDWSFFEPKNTGKRYRDNARNFFGLFGAYLNPTINDLTVSDIKINGATLNSEIIDMGTAEVVDLDIVLNWTENGAPQSRTISGVKEIKGMETIEYPLSGLNNGTEYSINAKFKARHRFGGTVEYKVNEINKPGSLTTTTMLTCSDATDITPNSAKLNGTLSDLGGGTEVSVLFEYGETSGGPYDIGSTDPRTLDATEPFEAPISDLSPDTTYYFRAKATIGTEVQYSPEEGSLVTEPATPPSISTEEAGDVEKTSATLNGEVTDMGSAEEVDVSFEWGESSGSYPYQTEVQKITPTSTKTFSKPISGLNPGTTYYFRAKATVGTETYSGTEKSFDTIELVPPEVITDEATDIKPKSAKLNGQISNLGSAKPVKGSFEWGTSPGGPYDNYTSAQDFTESGAISAKLSGLSKDTTYYFRVKAIGDGTTYGEEESFTTFPK